MVCALHTTKTQTLLLGLPKDLIINQIGKCFSSPAVSHVLSLIRLSTLDRVDWAERHKELKVGTYVIYYDIVRS